MIAEKILNNRKVFLWGQVDDPSAKHVIEHLLFLELRDPGKEIQLIINSPGGYITSGFAIYDTIKSIRSPVSTVCSGESLHVRVLKQNVCLLRRQIKVWTP